MDTGGLTQVDGQKWMDGGRCAVKNKDENERKLRTKNNDRKSLWLT